MKQFHVLRCYGANYFLAKIMHLTLIFKAFELKDARCCY